jgi:hypothetical protein
MAHRHPSICKPITHCAGCDYNCGLGMLALGIGSHDFKGRSIHADPAGRWQQRDPMQIDASRD